MAPARVTPRHLATDVTNAQRDPLSRPTVALRGKPALSVPELGHRSASVKVYARSRDRKRTQGVLPLGGPSRRAGSWSPRRLPLCRVVSRVSSCHDNERRPDAITLFTNFASSLDDLHPSTTLLFSFYHLSDTEHRCPTWTQAAPSWTTAARLREAATTAACALAFMCAASRTVVTDGRCSKRCFFSLLPHPTLQTDITHV